MAETPKELQSLYKTLPSSVLTEQSRASTSRSGDEPTPDSVMRSLGVTDAARSERVTGKVIQLEDAKGRLSAREQRKRAERTSREEAQRAKSERERDYGLFGRRRKRRSGDYSHHVSYETMLGLHTMWLAYMSELLSLGSTVPNYGLAQQKLVKAEFVGARLSVARARNKDLERVAGIVIQETQGTFKVVTPESQVKVIPKQGTVFELRLPISTTDALSFEIFGDNFAHRSYDRVSRKWKNGSGSGCVNVDLQRYI